MTSAPKFHLQRVFDDGATSAPEILPILDLPHDARLTRREFVGSGMTIASVLAAIGTNAAAQTPAAKAAAGPPEPKSGADPVLRPVQAHPGTIGALAITSDSGTLVSGGSDGKIKLWSVSGAKLQRTLFADPQRAITHLAFTRDGRILAAASDNAVKSWLWPKGTPGKASLPIEGRVAAMAIASDGQLIVASRDRSVRSWPIEEATGPGRDLDVGEAGTISLAASPDGKWLAAGQTEGRAMLWNLTADRERVPLSGQKADFREIAFAPNGSFLVATTFDGKVALWAMPAVSPLQRSAGPRARVARVVVTPDSQRIICGCVDGTIAILPVTRLAGSYETLVGHDLLITALALSPDGRVLASGDSGGVIILWDLVKGERIGYAFDPAASRNDGITYSVRDSVTGQLITYTLPCGSPIPAGATCVCNCVPGTYRPPVSAPAGSGTYRGGGRICTCDKVCTCVPVRSDRNIKTDFASVDPQTVLEGLAGLPITQWRYRDDDPSIRHIGPMAQDFAAAFGVGGDERSIHPVDAQGVAIASIQALHRALGEALEELKAQRARIEELRGEVQQLKARSR